MRQLVQLAESREAAAKGEIAGLLEHRSGMYEKENAAAPDVGGGADERATLITEVERSMETAKAKFNKLRTMCIGAEQGLKSLLERLMIALEEIHPEQLRASQLRGGHHGNHGHGHFRGGKGAGAGVGSARRGGSAQVPPHTPDRVRRSAGAASALGLGSRSQSPMMVPPSPGGGEKPSSPLHGTSPGPGDAGLGESGMPEGAGEELEESGIPSPLAGEGNTIDDEHFFPELPELLTSVTERLNRISVLGSELDATAIGESGGSECACGVRAGTMAFGSVACNVLSATLTGMLLRGLNADPEDSMAMSGAGVDGEGGAPASPSRVPDGGLTESERTLVKGMNRRTWTGAPLLETIAANPGEAALITTMKRKKGKKKEQQVQPDLNRILGYTGSDVEEEVSSRGRGLAVMAGSLPS